MIYQDQIKNLFFTCAAVAVTPSDTVDLPIPGTLFLDNTGTEGNVKVDLLNGGTVVIAITKALCFANTCVVKRVYATGGTTAETLFLNPVQQ